MDAKRVIDDEAHQSNMESNDFIGLEVESLSSGK